MTALMYIRFALWPLHRLKMKQSSVRWSSAIAPVSSSSNAGSHATLCLPIHDSLRLCRHHVAHFNDHYLWQTEHNFKAEQLDLRYTLDNEFKRFCVNRLKEPTWITRDWDEQMAFV